MRYDMDDWASIGERAVVVGYMALMERCRWIEPRDKATKA